MEDNNLNKIVLRSLSLPDKHAFQQAIASWNEPGFSFAGNYNPQEPFVNYLQLLKNYQLGINLPLGRVPDTVLFAFLGDEIVGRLSIRHKLNEHLEKLGGHIGYGVLPQFRRKGIATTMLQYALPIAKELGLEKVLVTCNDNNIGSIKIIEKAGGVLENIVTVDDAGSPPKRRYWITLS